MNSKRLFIEVFIISFLTLSLIPVWHRDWFVKDVEVNEWDSEHGVYRATTIRYLTFTQKVLRVGIAFTSLISIAFQLGISVDSFWNWINREKELT